MKTKQSETVQDYVSNIRLYERLINKHKGNRKTSIVIASISGSLILPFLATMCATGFDILACTMCGIFLVPISIIFGKSLSKIRKRSLEIKQIQNKIDETKHKIELKNNQKELSPEISKKIVPTELFEGEATSFNVDELQK